MVSLILKECLTYLLVIVYAACMRVKLAVVRGVTVSLNVLCISGNACIYGCRLTGRTVRVDLLFVQHLHFLGLIAVIALRRRRVVLPILLELSILLMAQAIHVLYAS